jgi:uncharacterized LabA/DUF88 family protein
MGNIRVSFYIDGFNVYHNIDKYQQETGQCFKWLNYRSLLESLLEPDEQIVDIYFFTSISEYHPRDSQARHWAYIKALKSENITIIRGNFSPKPIKCNVRDCNFTGDKIFSKLEEKKTDVNIAVLMTRDAYLNKYDKCFLMSADSDFVPVFQAVKERGKIPGLIVPPSDGEIIITDRIEELKDACFNEKLKKNIMIRLDFEMLRGHSFPERFYDKYGSLIYIPPQYQTF